MSLVTATDLKRKYESNDRHVYSSGTLWSTAWNNPTPVPRGSCSRIVTADFSRISGWNLPNFHRRKRKGELLPQLQWNLFKQTGSTSGSYDFKTGTLPSWSRWYTVGNYSFTDSWIVAEDEAMAYVTNRGRDFVQEAAGAIYSQGFDALTFLAELADVRRLFTDTLKTLVKVRFPKNWRSMSCEWLSARYGWRTLIYDMIGINEVIQQYNSNADKRSRHSERKGDSNIESIIYELDLSSEDYYDWIASVTDNIKVGNRGSVVADIEVPRLQFNPLQTGWEIIPFSFVLDWFVSVGKALSAISFLCFNTRYAASFGCSVEFTRSFSAMSTNHRGRYIAGGKSQTGTSTVVIRRREPCKIPLTPHLSFRMNGLKVFDLLAILIQRTRR